MGDWSKSLRAAVGGVAPRALRAGAAVIAADSDRRVPVSSGALRASSRVTATSEVATVSYTEPYAVVVHEDMTARHVSGQAKFLETAARVSGGAAMQAVADELRRAL